MERKARHKLSVRTYPDECGKFILNFSTFMSRERIDIGASVNGKPTVSKTVTAGSSPAAPEVLDRIRRSKKRAIRE